MSLRDDIVANARWGVANEPLIHYTQAAGRMAAVHSPRSLPLYTDCSGFVTECYSWAGAPDPNGRNYNGSGFTGTLLDHLEHIQSDELQPADLIVFGPYPGDHVVIVVETGDDPLCVSHGQEAGPILVRLSVEARAHRAPVFYLRGDGLDTPPPAPAPVHQEDDMPIIYQRGHGADVQSFLLAGDKLVFQAEHEVMLLASKGAAVVEDCSDKSWANLVHRLGDPDTV